MQDNGGKEGEGKDLNLAGECTNGMSLIGELGRRISILLTADPGVLHLIKCSTAVRLPYYLVSMSMFDGK
jgi:hypothetical protein